MDITWRFGVVFIYTFEPNHFPAGTLKSAHEAATRAASVKHCNLCSILKMEISVLIDPRKQHIYRGRDTTTQRGVGSNQRV